MTRNDHVAFEVADMDAALEFYTQALGMRLLFRSSNVEVGEDYAFLELEGGNLELIQRLSGPPFERPEIKAPYCPHLALTTTDMAATVQMIEDKHVPLVKGPLLVEGEETWLYVHDPDNNVIEYIQWLSQDHR